MPPLPLPALWYAWYALAMPAPILPLVEAAAHWPERGALIGLDLGTKTIGVAVSDPDRRLATGVETIQRKAFKADAARLLALAAERSATGFVLGLPINMDGSEGPRAQSTRAFARNLAGLTGLPIGLWDERLSTAAVERELIGMDAAPNALRSSTSMPRSSSQGALDRLKTLRGTADGESSSRRAAGIPADRARLRPQAQPDATGHAMARAGEADLLRAVPTLLIQTLVKADLSHVPVAGVGGALLLSALAMSLLCLALRPLFSRWNIDGPAFTSIFQGATRWQTYVALAVAGNLYGQNGLALASVAMVAIIPLVNVLSVWVLAHYASPEKQSVRAIVGTVVKNPLIWACVIGLAVNVTQIPLPKIWHEVAEALGRSSLGIGLLVTGAGLHLEGLLRPRLAASIAVFLKLILMPVFAIALALSFGITGSSLVIVAVCSAVPTSSSAYVMARDGGDAPLLAQIITLQTIWRRSRCRS